MESFGIPNAEANLQALQEMAAANGDLLRHVGAAMVTPLLETISNNEAGLKYVESTLRRSLAGRAAAGRKSLVSVQDALLSALTAQAAVSGSLLAEGMSGTAALPEAPVVVAPSATPPPSTEPQPLPEHWAVYYDLSIDSCILIPESVYSSFSTAMANDYRAGPFDSRIEADMWVQDHPGECVRSLPPLPPIPIPTPPPTPPSPPPPTPPPTPLPMPVIRPLAQCMPVGQNKAFPEVGSPEFCACLDDLRQWFADLGRLWLDFFFGSTRAAVETTGFLSGALSGLLGLVGLDFPGANLISGVASWVSARVEEVWRALSETLTGSPLCNPAEILGIALARTLIHALNRVHLGADIPFLATAELSITIPQLEVILDYVSNHACPVEIPAPAEAIECLLRGSAPEEQVRCWLAMRGVSLDVWKPVLDSRRERLTTPEVIQILRRRGVSLGEQTEALVKRGWLRPEEAFDRVELYDELPTVADFIHFLTRNVFNKEYVRDYGLMDGFDERFWATYGPALRAIGMSREWAAEHYAAHWINPAPTQMQEFVYRLRPGKEGVQNPFTVEDYIRLLAEQDVAPFAAKRFAETIYRVPALGYLRDMYRQGVISDDELKGYHQDLGYTEADSERFVRIDRLQRDRMRATAGHGWNPSAIAKAYIAGALDQTEVQIKMGDLGYSSREADDLMARAESDVRYSILVRSRSRAISAGATSIRAAQLAGVTGVEGAVLALSALGYPEDMARGIALATDATLSVDLVKKATARVKHALLSGEVTEEYARAALDQLGIERSTAARFLLAWAVENTPGRKRRTASQITRDVAEGQLSTAEALARLANLGYADGDSRLFLADAARQIVKRQAAALAAGQRGSRAQAKELQGLQRQARQQADKAAALLKRLTPVGKLQKWVQLGLIGKPLFFSRMEAMGYAPELSTKYYEEACAKKGSLCETEPAGSAPAPGGAGSTGGPGG